MGIFTVVFALCHRSQQSGCKTECPSLLLQFAICHPEVNDVIAKLSLVDKVYTLGEFMALWPLKVGVIAWKAVMTVEVAGLRGSGC